MVLLMAFSWAFWTVYQSTKHQHFINQQDLQEIILENVTSLQSLTHHSQKYPTSGIAIVQHGDLYQFKASCIGASSFCAPRQKTDFSDNTTLILLMPKNASLPTSGLIKEIRHSQGVLMQNGTAQMDEYLSQQHSSYFWAKFTQAVAFVAWIWAVWKVWLACQIERLKIQ